MSFILKALKKLEEEKAAQQPSPRDINMAILSPERASSPKPLPAAKLAAIILVLVPGCGTAYILFRQDSLQPSSAQSPQGGIPGEKIAGPPGTTQADPVPPVLEQGISASAGPGEIPNNREINPPGEKGKTALASPPRRRPQEGLQSDADRPRREPFGPVPSGVKVSGIALQDDPAESVAVVNGMLIRRGMPVQDLKVEEIYSDRVKFSGNGQVWEIYVPK